MKYPCQGYDATFQSFLKAAVLPFSVPCKAVNRRQSSANSRSGKVIKQYFKAKRRLATLPSSKKKSHSSE